AAGRRGRGTRSGGGPGDLPDGDVHLTDDAVDGGGDGRLGERLPGVVDVDLVDLDLALVHLQLLGGVPLLEGRERRLGVLELDLRGAHLALGLVRILRRLGVRRAERVLRLGHRALVAADLARAHAARRRRGRRGGGGGRRGRGRRGARGRGPRRRRRALVGPVRDEPVLRGVQRRLGG